MIPRSPKSETREYKSKSRPFSHLCTFLGRWLKPAAVIMVAVLAVYTGLTNSSAATIYGLPVDRQVDSNGTLQDLGLMGPGSHNASFNSVAVMVFQLPTLPVGQKFSAVGFTSYLLGQNGAPTFNVDLYGLGVDSVSTVLASDYYAGPLDSSNTLLLDNYITPSTPGVTFPSTSVSLLTDYLNICYANGTNAGQYVFLRLSPDTAALSWNYYHIASAEYQAPSNFYWPRLSYSTATIGTPGWSTVPLGGGGAVTGIVSDSSGNDVYCRTDVGGAFKWNATTLQWDSISDHMVSSSEANCWDLMGTTSLVVDPNNANVLYMAVGNSNGYGHKGIYASSNKGSTWTFISPASPNPEFYGRASYDGERLAVDPNNSNILWYGSQQVGLQKGVKSGGTWTWTQIPGTSVPFGATNAGIKFVACDKNGASTIVYAGVHDATTGGIYKSTDGGTTWSKVTGAAVTTPLVGRIASNGTLYVTTGTSTVLKMLRGGSLTALPGLSTLNYKGLAVALSDPAGDTVYVAETNSNRNIRRSTDGGANWVTQLDNFNNLAYYPRYEADGVTSSAVGSWFSQVIALHVNPANPDEFWTADLFGVSRTLDAQNFGTTNGAHYNILQKGQEETVVLALKNAPTGQRLLAGIADINGFRYQDTYSRPYGTAGAPLRNPSSGSTGNFDFSESNNNIWARTWTNTFLYGGGGATSKDGGVTWLPFGQIDGKWVTNAPTDSLVTFDLSTYLARQKALGNNTVTIAVCSGSTTPSNSAAGLSFDSKEGPTSSLWPKLIVNGSTNLTPVADTYVNGAATATNYGAATTLQVAYCWGGEPAYSRYTYLRFDLSSVGAITSATLQLNKKAAGANTTQFDLGVFACVNNTTFAENTLVWTNIPVPVIGDIRVKNEAPLFPNMTGAFHGGRVAVSATDPNNLVWLPLYASSGYGNTARYSKDRGATWTACTGAPNSQMQNEFSPSSCITQLTSDRVNGNFYMAKFGIGAVHTIYKSTDGGATFTQVGTIPGHYNGLRAQIVAAPGVANDLWLSDASDGLFHSTDGGTTWAQVGTYQVMSAREVSFGKPQAGSGYAYTVFINGFYNNFITTTQGIYRSDNYGANWTLLGTMPTIAVADSLAGDRQVYGRVYVGTQGRGIFQFQ